MPAAAVLSLGLMHQRGLSSQEVTHASISRTGGQLLESTDRRLRKAATRLALLLALVHLSLSVCACKTDTRATHPDEITVVTYNAHYMERGLPGIVATLRPLHADVVAMQEVLFSGPYNAAADTARRLGTNVVSSSPYVGHGQTGWVLAVLTPHTVVSRDERLLGWNRRALRATILVRGRKLHVVTLHLTPFTSAPPIEKNNQLTAAARQREIADLLNWVGSPAEPVVILGDFNMLRGPVSLMGFNEYAQMTASAFRDADGGLLPLNEDTFPLDEAARAGARKKLPGWLIPSAITLDYVFHSSHFKAVSVKAIASAASDHWPLVARLRFRPR